LFLHRGLAQPLGLDTAGELSKEQVWNCNKEELLAPRSRTCEDEVMIMEGIGARLTDNTYVRIIQENWIKGYL
jgi:hypothetical protein